MGYGILGVKKGRIWKIGDKKGWDIGDWKLGIWDISSKKGGIWEIRVKKGRIWEVGG